MRKICIFNFFYLVDMQHSEGFANYNRCCNSWRLTVPLIPPKISLLIISFFTSNLNGILVKGPEAETDSLDNYYQRF